MKIYAFASLLLLCVACSKVRTENDFYDEVVKECANKPTPQKTVLGIDYNMTYSEMEEYLFFLGETNNNIVGGARNSSFEEKTKGMSMEDKKRIYLLEYKYKDIFYRIQSDSGDDYVFGEISAVDPTNLRYGILFVFEKNINKVDQIAYPIYTKKYGEPDFISKDKMMHIWINDNQLVKYEKYGDKVYVIYSDAVLFSKEFEKFKISSEKRKKDYSKDL